MFKYYLILKSFKGDKLNPWIKIIIGLVLAVASAWYIINGFQGIVSPGWEFLFIVIKGLVPLLAFIFGIFWIWLNWDEIRIEKELEKESEKPRPKRKR